ncbi:translation elongation factor P (EF-P) [Knoellia subterranea KCTC 19937]|uniref:Translation elongation factor P (EF-P) n=2 Tax=Knoellia TaxID=136099 RepID=A0A0A0JGA0_9MICO|nr:translation elongation factor P (EF-P) [Knoellia subterranea KCTC 19937]
MNIWPPFAFAGIRITELSDDFRRVRVELGSHLLTRNYVGTQFGGSIFSMSDPFWMFLTLRSLGDDYIVWDQAAEVRFVRPGRGRLHLTVEVTDAFLDELREAAKDGDKVLRWVESDVLDDDGEVVAQVRRQLYVRLKKKVTERTAVAV